MRRRHKLERLRIALNVEQQYSDPLMERCSSLFHRQLTSLIVSIFDRVQRDIDELFTADVIVLDLGEITLYDFENVFCQRLERELLRVLSNSSILQEVTKTPIVMTTPQLGVFADTIDFDRLFLSDPLKVSTIIDAWSLEKIESQYPDWGPTLARNCLQRKPLAGLYRVLRPTTFAKICQYLASVKCNSEAMSPLTLLLSALCYFHQRPNCQTPLLHPGDCDLSILKFDSAAEIMKPVAFNGIAKQLLVRLFSSFGSASPFLVEWLHALWRESPVRHILGLELPAEIFQRLCVLLAKASVVPVTKKYEQRGILLKELDHIRLTDSTVRDSTDRVISADVFPAINKLEVHEGSGGITLLWPLLPTLFEKVGILKNSSFLNREAQHKAVCLLDELIWADGKYADWRMPINKFLCGLPPDTKVEFDRPDVTTVDIIESWLLRSSENIYGWRRLSLADIRQLFLQRPARLEKADDTFTLYIRAEAYDVLLGEWPWPRDMLILPWLARPLPIQWQELSDML